MPNSKPCRGSGIGSDLSVSLSNGDTNNLPGLSDISERDRPWDAHKAESDIISGHYRNSEFEKYSERVNTCANLLDFRLVPDDKKGYRLKLSSARFCHVRTCQICVWRRSLMFKARAYKTLPKIVDDYPTARFLFLTLTVKNCQIHELREYLSWMNKGFSRLIRLKAFPAIGYLKTVEVTLGRDGRSSHPHFHCLLMVAPSYFGKNYIRKDEWVAMWRNSLRVDYNPILDVQALKSNDSLVGLLAEIIKYQTKPSTMVFGNREWFLEYTRQLHRTRAISFGGVFKEYFRELEKEPTDEDLIGVSDDNETDEGHLLFGWRRTVKKYKLVDI